MRPMQGLPRSGTIDGCAYAVPTPRICDATIVAHMQMSIDKTSCAVT
jgi:hypothetical protein